MAKLIVNVPGRYKGDQIEVLYLGTFANGGEYEVDPEQSTLFVDFQRRHDDKWEWPKGGLLVGNKDAKLDRAPKAEDLPSPQIVEQGLPEGGES